MDKICVSCIDGKFKTVKCDKYNSCSFYKKGQCLCAGKVSCGFGYIDNRGSKNDSLYDKLSVPSNTWRVALIDNMVIFNLEYAICAKKGFYNWGERVFDVDDYRMGDWGHGKYSFIPLEELTLDVLYMIVTYSPTRFANEICERYTSIVVPNVLYDLSKVLPELYDRLLVEYPELKEVEPNFVGRVALMSSLIDGIVLPDSKGKFTKMGGYLICDNYNIGLGAPWGAEKVKLEVEITPNMVYKINNNIEVDGNTVFM